MRSMLRIPSPCHAEIESGGQHDFHSSSGEAICLKASRLILGRNPLAGNDLQVDRRAGGVVESF